MLFKDPSFFPTEECAFAFLSSEKEDCGSHTGIPTVMEAYKVHKDNADVVEAIVRLLLELSHYGEFLAVYSDTVIVLSLRYWFVEGLHV